MGLFQKEERRKSFHLPGTKNLWCTVKCGNRIQGFFPTNLAHHLQRKHPEAYREYEEKQKLKKIEKENTRREKTDAGYENLEGAELFDPCPSLDPKYEASNPKQQRFDTKLAM